MNLLAFTVACTLFGFVNGLGFDKKWKGGLLAFVFSPFVHGIFTGLLVVP